MLARGACFATALLLLTPSQATAASGTEPFVIVIGNNLSLDKGVKPLRYADDDALRYFELFSLVSKRVALFTVLDRDTARLHSRLARHARPPELAAILTTLKRYNRQMKALAKQGKRSELVFVYAGHGDIDKSGEGYVNLQRKKLRRRDLYKKIIGPSQASYVHLIIDACKSYFLVNRRGKWKRDQTKRGKAGDAELAAFLKKEDLAAYPKAGVILATSGDESTHEWSRYRGGILSHELRSALAGAADVNGDGRIEYSEVHAFIAAANARIKNAKAKLDIWSRPPAANRSQPLFRPAKARRGRLLRFGPKLAGRYHLEDDRGVRAVDLHKAAGLGFDLALDRRRTYYLRRANKQALIRPGATRLAVASLRFGRTTLAARNGSLDRTFRRDLYRQPFSRGFYDGFVARTGHIAVAAATNVGAGSGAGSGAGTKLAAAPGKRGAKAGAARAGKASQGGKPTVAVLYFTYEGTDKQMVVLRKGLAEMLISDLAALEDVKVVERMRLEALLKELKLNRSRKIDRKSANKIGRLLGARYLAWGSYFKVFGSFCLSGKVVEVETGTTLPGGKACGKPGDFLSLYKKLRGSLENTLTTRLQAAPTRQPKRRIRPARRAGVKARLARKRARRKQARRKLPVRLTTRTALAYARALDAKDRGDTRTAKRELRKLLKEQPDFAQAKRMLAKLGK
jgi:TolB-like protein